MSPKAETPELSETMSVTDFENGYWYALELKDFADSIGIPSARKLRKDELEKSIRIFLKTGRTDSLTKRSLKKSGTRDVDIGLSLELPVVNYTSNRETKDFLVLEAEKIAPGLKRKSGARYRLNRWREEQLAGNIKITYKNLVDQYILLNQKPEKFEQIPHGRYINFLSDFMASEKNATKEDAIAAWHRLKNLDTPKTYAAWKKFKG